MKTNSNLKKQSFADDHVWSCVYIIITNRTRSQKRLKIINVLFIYW